MVPRRLHCQEGGLRWKLQQELTCRLAGYHLQGRQGLCLTQHSSPSQRQTDIIDFKRGFIKGMLPGCLQLTPVHPWNPSLLRFLASNWNQLGDVRGNTVVHTFPSFSLTTSQWHAEVSSMGHAVLLVHVQPPDSAVKQPWSISTLSWILWQESLLQNVEHGAEY